MSNSINLSLSVEEVNGILQALGNAPYVQVVALVENIKAQAMPQVQAQAQAVPQVQAQATPEPVAE